MQLCRTQICGGNVKKLFSKSATELCQILRMVTIEEEEEEEFIYHK